MTGPRRLDPTSHATGDDAALASSLHALADPTRRAVVALLAQGPLRAGQLAEALATTPPALSRHLRVLRHSGLVGADDLHEDARVRLYRLRLESLAPLHDWLEELRGFWTDQLAGFKLHAERADAVVPRKPGR